MQDEIKLQEKAREEILSNKMKQGSLRLISLRLQRHNDDDGK